MSPDCREIVELLRGGEEERKEGARLLFELPFIRQYAFYWHRRYRPRIEEAYPVWHDLYVETVFDFIEKVDEGQVPHTNGKAYVSNLCRNLCGKALLGSKQDEAFDKSLEHLLKVEGIERSPFLMWVEFLLKKMECKCESLLRWSHVQVPRLKDKAELSKNLQEECGRDITPNAIPVHLHHCRNKFRELAKDYPFDDFIP